MTKLANKEKLGIFFIGIGSYKLFFDDFINSCCEFLKDIELKFIVFSDDPSYFEKWRSKVDVYRVENHSWPGNTLFRYRFFEIAKRSTYECTHILFLNANARIEKDISFSELHGGRRFFSVIHPACNSFSSKRKPFDRNIFSKAFVPYSGNFHYLQGFLIGGVKDDFYNMCQEINMMILSDLKKRVVARVHDESYQNKYLINRDVNYLHPGYAYPDGYKIDFDKVIRSLDKDLFFEREASTKIKKFNWIDFAEKFIYKLFCQFELPVIFFRPTRKLLSHFMDIKGVLVK